MTDAPLGTAERAEHPIDPADDLAGLIDEEHDGPSMRPRLRTVLLSALTTLVGTGIAVVVFSNAYAGATSGPSTDQPDPAVSAVQQYTAPDGFSLKRVKRDALTAVAAPAAEADVSAADLPPLKAVAPAGEAQQYAATQVSARGWSKKDFACLVSLWSKESGWNAHAGRVNGPYGIPQAYPGTKMASAGGDWLNDHRVQIRWGLGYIAGRYGTPCGAWANSVAHGSY